MALVVSTTRTFQARLPGRSQYLPTGGARLLLVCHSRAMVTMVLWTFVGLLGWFALTLPIAIVVGRSIGAGERRVAEQYESTARAA